MQDYRFVRRCYTVSLQGELIVLAYQSRPDPRQ
jgi:hypothetical protein